jgi:hypothetical protein
LGAAVIWEYLGRKKNITRRAILRGEGRCLKSSMQLITENLNSIRQRELQQGGKEGEYSSLSGAEDGF